MPTPAPYSTPFALIASAIVGRVASTLSIAPEFNHIVASDDYKVTEAENIFVYTRVYGPSPVDGKGNSFPDIGAGRLGRMVSRRLRFYIYTRSGVDEYGDDTIALMSTTPAQTALTPPTFPGQFVAEESILNSFDDWTPLNSDASLPLTIGPLHWLDSADGPPERPPENEAGLIRSHLDFEVVYISAINPAEPPQ